MELEELRPHWKIYRTSVREENLSEEELYDLLPAGAVSPFWRMLTTTTRYVAVYGFLFFCCTGC